MTFTAPASGMTWIFNPGGKATKSVRPYCRLKINTAEAAIDAPFAAGNLRLVLRDYEPDPIPVHLGHAILRLKPRRFTKFDASRLRKSLAADPAKLSAPKTCAEKKK